MESTAKQDIIMYRRQKSHDLLHDAKILIDNSLWNSAVNRLYYACFHSVSALLILNDINVKSHLGLRQKFGLHFIKNGIFNSECGHIFTKMYDMRQTSDYDDFREFSEAEVLDVYPKVIHLIEQIDKYIDQHQPHSAK